MLNHLLTLLANRPAAFDGDRLFDPLDATARRRQLRGEAADLYRDTIGDDADDFAAVDSASLAASVVASSPLWDYLTFYDERLISRGGRIRKKLIGFGDIVGEPPTARTRTSRKFSALIAVLSEDEADVVVDANGESTTASVDPREPIRLPGSHMSVRAYDVVPGTVHRVLAIMDSPTPAMSWLSAFDTERVDSVLAALPYSEFRETLRVARSEAIERVFRIAIGIVALCEALQHAD